MHLSEELGPRVTVERIRRLFGNAGPVRVPIWESQFDGADDELQALAQTPWDELSETSFWVYFHDLNYVELQPELFAYLFPACLTLAQRRLMSGKHGVEDGDSDFLRALAVKNWTQACTPVQIQATYEILIDGFLDRLDGQRGFRGPEDKGIEDPVSRYNWIWRFNSLGYILPSIEPLWNRWWQMETPGAAIAALEYAWSLAAPEETDETLDDLIPLWWRADSEPDANLYGLGWEAASLAYLTLTLGTEYLRIKTQEAVTVLAGRKEDEIAKIILNEVETQPERIDTRLAQLYKELGEPYGSRWDTEGSVP